MLVTESVATQVHEEAHTLSAAEVAGYLQERLGQRMAAYLAGLSDAKQVGLRRRDARDGAARVLADLRPTASEIAEFLRVVGPEARDELPRRKVPAAWRAQHRAS